MSDTVDDVARAIAHFKRLPGKVPTHAVIPMSRYRALIKSLGWRWCYRNWGLRSAALAFEMCGFAWQVQRRKRYERRDAG